MSRTSSIARAAAKRETRGGRRNQGFAVASTAIAAASAIRRAEAAAASAEAVALSPDDRETLKVAREVLLLQVADSAQMPLRASDHKRAAEVGTVARARLALDVLDSLRQDQEEPETQLRRLLQHLDALLGEEPVEDLEGVRAYFEGLADAALRSGTSTGEVLVGGRRS